MCARQALDQLSYLSTLTSHFVTNLEMFSGIWEDVYKFKARIRAFRTDRFAILGTGRSGPKSAADIES